MKAIMINMLKEQLQGKSIKVYGYKYFRNNTQFFVTNPIPEDKRQEMVELGEEVVTILAINVLSDRYSGDTIEVMIQHPTYGHLFLSTIDLETEFEIVQE